MPFLDDVEDLKAKTPAGGMPVPVVAGIALVVLLVLAFAGLQAASSARGGFAVDTGASSSPAASAAYSAESGESAPDGSGASDDAGGCYVYVVGAVRDPGVYEVASDARVNDAVSAAGGLADDADAAAVNLARQVVDGEQIVIPVQGAAGETAVESAAVENAAATTTGTALSAVPAASAGITPDGKVNLNMASSEELQTLSGVGEATAAKIIASRESEGPFQTTEDLKRVSGIGEKKYAAIADSIVV